MLDRFSSLIRYGSDVVVQLDDLAITGTVTRSYGGWIVVSEASIIRGDRTVPLDGAGVAIPYRSIQYIQVVRS